MPSNEPRTFVDERRELPVEEGLGIALSVVVPAYNQAAGIEANVAEIERRIAAGFDGAFEIVVVSDGSEDRTVEHALRLGSERVRVFHYDRNLGKGYAVKLGALESRGRWVACVDADLDLDPAGIPAYMRLAEEQNLDFVIGSKRHPDSEVHYPRSRRMASWAYQQLVRLLFRLEVRDTQVGLKLFRREIADDVLPLLLVKRYAFDLELLAVARSMGFRRIVEQPVRLDYQFSGSGVRSLAVLRALIDTAAVFYRLRILRYYDRKRRVMGPFGTARPRGGLPLVSLVCSAETAERLPDHERLEVITIEPGVTSRQAALRAHGDVLAFVAPGGRPAVNFLSATVPFLERPDVPAVVMPSLAPLEGSIRMRAAAVVQESRLGGSSLYYRYTPGNIRRVVDYPAQSLVVRRDAYLALDDHVTVAGICSALAERGTSALYTPETVVVVAPAPLFRPHLRPFLGHGRIRGRVLRRGGPGRLRGSTIAALALVLFVAASVPAALTGGIAFAVWALLGIAYVAALAASSLIGALRFRSLRVGAVAFAGLVATHAAFTAALARGFFDR
jgi:glycosyltransferase involved in cell wall biosynthesis